MRTTHRLQRPSGVEGKFQGGEFIEHLSWWLAIVFSIKGGGNNRGAFPQLGNSRGRNNFSTFNFNTKPPQKTVSFGRSKENCPKKNLNKAAPKCQNSQLFASQLSTIFVWQPQKNQPPVQFTKWHIPWPTNHWLWSGCPCCRFRGSNSTACPPRCSPVAPWQVLGAWGFQQMWGNWCYHSQKKTWTAWELPAQPFGNDIAYKLIYFTGWNLHWGNYSTASNYKKRFKLILWKKTEHDLFQHRWKQLQIVASSIFCPTCLEFTFSWHHFFSWQFLQLFDGWTTRAKGTRRRCPDRQFADVAGRCPRTNSPEVEAMLLADRMSGKWPERCVKHAKFDPQTASNPWVSSISWQKKNHKTLIDPFTLISPMS